LRAKIVIAGLDPAIHPLRMNPAIYDPLARTTDARVKPAHDTCLCMNYWVYILGMTNNLVRRVYEHREGFVGGFTRRYGVKRLVYFEAHDTAIGALQREKNIKHWPREWKIDLIVRDNPTWRDLYNEIVR
jgi:putative endonuclease